MKSKIRAIVKRTDELYGHMTNISNTLENLQKTVGGYIEAVCIGKAEVDSEERDIVILCDEDGKSKHKMPNIALGMDIIVGDIVVVGADEEDFCDVPITFQEWKEMGYAG